MRKVTVDTNKFLKDIESWKELYEREIQKRNKS